MAKPFSQLTTRGSAVTAALLSGWRRLLVVLTEGLDLCPLKDKEKGSEFCEIEEQGGLVVDHRTWPVRSDGTEGRPVVMTLPYRFEG
jgi:hypothetical protein